MTGWIYKGELELCWAWFPIPSYTIVFTMSSLWPSLFLSFCGHGVRGVRIPIFYPTISVSIKSQLPWLCLWRHFLPSWMVGYSLEGFRLHLVARFRLHISSLSNHPIRHSSAGIFGILVFRLLSFQPRRSDILSQKKLHKWPFLTGLNLIRHFLIYLIARIFVLKITVALLTGMRNL